MNVLGGQEGPCSLLHAQVFSVSMAGRGQKEEKRLLGEIIFLDEKDQKRHSRRNSRLQRKVCTWSTQLLPTSVQKKSCSSLFFHVLLSGVKGSGSAPPFIIYKYKFKVG